MAASAPCRSARRRCVDEFAALEAFCERVAALRSRRADGLEHHRFRSQRAAENRRAGAIIHSRWGASPGATAHSQGRGLFRQRTGHHSRTRGARRHRPAARRLRAHGRLFARCRGARECSAKARRSRATCATAWRRSSTTTGMTWRRLRSTRAPMHGSPIEIVEKLESDTARVRAQPVDRHDAGPRGREHRIVRFSLPDGTAARARRRAQRAWRRLARACRAAGRPRARADRRACTATSGCSTSRACIRASSAPSTSIPCRFVADPGAGRRSDRHAERGASPRAGHPAAPAR